jgi:ADP-ribosyl-[dinitrogen reductase] hydrolase
MLRGGCCCGAVEYEIRQLDSPIGHCSCHTCRKSHAAAFNTSAGVKHENFRWVRGRDQLKAFESSPGKSRYFCSNCGSHLIAQRMGQDQVILRVATLDDDPEQKPAFQIWKSHAVAWLEYGSHVPAYPEWQPGRL